VQLRRPRRARAGPRPLPHPTGVSADLGVAPEVPATDAAPRCDLEISDVVVGTGAEASEGTATAVRYVGAFFVTELVQAG
jgi:hypothetical protein